MRSMQHAEGFPFRHDDAPRRLFVVVTACRAFFVRDIRRKSWFTDRQTHAVLPWVRAEDPTAPRISKLEAHWVILT